jgi:hypothetical protein
LPRARIRYRVFEAAATMSQPGNQVTLLLDAVERGDTRAADELFPLVYEELRQRAGKLLSLERREHTLQRTALVHEALSSARPRGL